MAHNMAITAKAAVDSICLVLSVIASYFVALSLSYLFLKVYARPTPRTV